MKTGLRTVPNSRFASTHAWPGVLWAMALGLAACDSAGAFEVKAENPAFVVTVPRLPAVRLEPRAVADPRAGTFMAGSDDTYTIDLRVTKAASDTTARTCAGNFLRALIARPGMPDRDNIYRTPLDENTFLVLYVLVEDGRQRLHAHLLSSANATHCIEVQFSRPRRDGEDDEGWRQTFTGSHIEDEHR